MLSSARSASTPRRRKQLANMPQGTRTDLRPIELMSQAEAAGEFIVGLSCLKRAKAVLEKAAPEVVDLESAPSPH
jgi:hypothetical protein